MSTQARSWEVHGWENRGSELIGMISIGIGIISLEFGFSIDLSRGCAGIGSDPGLSLDLSHGFPATPGRSEDSRGFLRSRSDGELFCLNLPLPGQGCPPEFPGAGSRSQPAVWKQPPRAVPEGFPGSRGFAVPGCPLRVRGSFRLPLQARNCRSGRGMFPAARRDDLSRSGDVNRCPAGIRDGRAGAEPGPWGGSVGQSRGCAAAVGRSMGQSQLSGGICGAELGQTRGRAGSVE